MPAIKIDGMRCQNCSNAVSKALNGFPDLVNVQVSLEKGEASWDDRNPAAPADLKKIKDAICKIGFEAK